MVSIWSMMMILPRFGGGGEGLANWRAGIRFFIGLSDLHLHCTYWDYWYSILLRFVGLCMLVFY